MTTVLGTQLSGQSLCSLPHDDEGSSVSSTLPPPKDSIPELPPHWFDEFSGPAWLQPVLKATFRTLCMVAVGHRTLWHTRRAACSEETFMKKGLVSNRIVVTSVVMRRALFT